MHLGGRRFRPEEVVDLLAPLVSIERLASLDKVCACEHTGSLSLLQDLSPERQVVASRCFDVVPVVEGDRRPSLLS